MKSLGIICGCVVNWKVKFDRVVAGLVGKPLLNESWDWSGMEDMGLEKVEEPLRPED
jgi:hypothetical protein